MTQTLNAKYTFNNFVVGKSNTIFYAASLAVAESPGEIYNPLFISDLGLGKTHLMGSIAHFIVSIIKMLRLYMKQMNIYK